MKKTVNFFSIILFCFAINAVHAQKSVVASGGKATGAGGTASFSVGIISYKNPDGSLQNTGIQQPYEIFTLKNLTFDNQQIQIVAYPNPVNNFLKISVDSTLISNLSYLIFDSNGKTISSQTNIETTEMPIYFESFTAGIYFVSIRKENREIKNFKIIKR
jgi:hypothetical protein